VACLTDVDERGLHARQHVLHASKVDVAHRGNLLDVGDVMLDQHVVLDHRDLGMVFLFANHHQAVHVLATRQEILFHQLRLAGTLAAIVTATLLFRLKTCGALDVGDLIDVLLLARTTNQRSLLLVLRHTGAAAATATTRHARLFLILPLGMTGTGRIARRGFGVMACSAATATTRHRLLAILVAMGIRGPVARLRVNRRVGDVVVFEVLFDLLHLGGGAALLRVQATAAAGAAGGGGGG